MDCPCISADLMTRLRRRERVKEFAVVVSVAAAAAATVGAALRCQAAEE